jgi:nucleotide-binding universal stress UspA family protein
MQRDRADRGGALTLRLVHVVPERASHFQRCARFAVVFSRILCGVDETGESLVAVRQSGALLAPGGLLSLVVVVDTGAAAQAGFTATRAAAQLEGEAAQAIEAARGQVPAGIEAATRVVRGRRIQVLRKLIDEERPDLMCVGTHDRRRASGVALGSVTTTMLHEAPCSVLVARPSAPDRSFPASILVGMDGSAESASALACARELARRCGASVSAVAAMGGKGIDDRRVAELEPGYELVPGKPVPGLVDRSADHDLLVVGSRGLHGLRALGSVSERVAHRAKCSVLVVRSLPEG